MPSIIGHMTSKDTAAQDRPARAVGVVLLAALLVTACGDPGVFVWAENRSAADVLVRYEQPGGDQVYLVPTGARGYLGGFGPESSNDLVVLTLDCLQIGDVLPAPEMGGVIVRIANDGAATSEDTPVPKTFDDPRLERIAKCGDGTSKWQNYGQNE